MGQAGRFEDAHKALIQHGDAAHKGSLLGARQIGRWLYFRRAGRGLTPFARLITSASGNVALTTTFHPR